MAFIDLHFLRPWWLLGLIPAVALFLLLWRANPSTEAWKNVCEAHLLEHLWLKRPGRQRRWPLGLLLLGWLLTVLALAGPSWEKTAQPVFQSQNALVLLLDLSESMNANDIAPSRLDRARFKIQDILAHHREGLTALIVFAGEAHIVTPLTDDAATIKAMLPALATDIMPVGGNNATDALLRAAALLHQTGNPAGEILLLSDGIDDLSLALQTAGQLRRKGVRISVLGISRQTQPELMELARAGGGHYHLLTPGNQDIDAVLEPLSAQSLQAKERQGRGVERWIERGPWLLLPLLVLAALGYRKGWLGVLLLGLVLPPPSQAGWADLWRNHEQRALHDLKSGQAEQAAKAFRSPDWKGVAQYTAGDYLAAAKTFASQEGAEAAYNRGNALAKAGKLQEAIQAYEQALAEQPEHADARFNLALIKRLLQQQQQQQQQQRRASQNQGKQNASDAEKQSNEQSEDSKAEHNQAQEKDQSNASPAKKSPPEQTQEKPKSQPQNDSEGEPRDEHDDRVEESPRSATDNKDTPPPQPVPDAAAAKPEQPPNTQKPQGSDHPQEQSEEDMALDQWLRRIPDDPAGLLRRKFMLEHLLRQQGKE